MRPSTEDGSSLPTHTPPYLIMMRTAMNMEHTGSAIIQPKAWMSMEEMMTPTLPRVSARMCRKMPAGQQDVDDRK